jgi:hypothetical protein
MKARPTFGTDVRFPPLACQPDPKTLASLWEPDMSGQYPSASPKVRATLYLPQDLLEEARNATVHLGGYPLRLTLTKLVERAFRAELQRLKDTYNAGCDFPPREEDLKGGRPIAA